MCVVKKPKVKTTPEKEPIVIRNPFLDGVDPTTKALRQGRSTLRIERAGSGTAPAVPPATAPPTSPLAIPAPAAPAVNLKISAKDFAKQAFR